MEKHKQLWRRQVEKTPELEPEKEALGWSTWSPSLPILRCNYVWMKNYRD